MKRLSDSIFGLLRWLGGHRFAAPGSEFAERRTKLKVGQVLLILVGINGLAAMGMNTLAYLILWPEWIKHEWREMLLLPLIMSTIITIPVIFTNLKLLQLMTERADTLERELFVDSLTQVGSRYGFEKQSQSLIDTHGSGALMVIDLDHFKAINDTYGHAEGDRVLRRVGDLLTERLRKTDLIGRLGGEEFAVLLPGCGAAEARKIAADLRDAIEAEQFTAQDTQAGFRCTMSIGLISFSEPRPYPALFAQADKRLYEAKAAGRNCVCGDLRARGASPATPAPAGQPQEHV